MNIDDVIDKIDNSDLSALKGMCVHFRSRGVGFNTNRYFVSTSQTGCSPYVVEINPSTLKKLKIYNHLVLQSSCHQDYLDNQTIEQAVIAYLKLNVCLIFVDNEGNVYINPSAQDLPTLLRKGENTNPKDIEQFEHYKENWYIRK
jgi:hypothetical protein